VLLQEFDYEIEDRKGSENLVVDHLSRIVASDISESPICDCFYNEQLFRAQVEPWFANIVNYLVTREMLRGWKKDARAYFLSIVCFCVQDGPHLFKYCPDQIIRRCIPDDQIHSVMSFCHDQSYGGHFSQRKIVAKIL